MWVRGCEWFINPCYVTTAGSILKIDSFGTLSIVPKLIESTR
jgi:hypothetical protein